MRHRTKYALIGFAVFALGFGGGQLFESVRGGGVSAQLSNVAVQLQELQKRGGAGENGKLLEGLQRMEKVEVLYGAAQIDIPAIRDIVGRLEQGAKSCSILVQQVTGQTTSVTEMANTVKSIEASLNENLGLARQLSADIGNSVSCNDGEGTKCTGGKASISDEMSSQGARIKQLVSSLQRCENTSREVSTKMVDIANRSSFTIEKIAPVLDRISGSAIESMAIRLDAAEKLIIEFTMVDSQARCSEFTLIAGAPYQRQAVNANVAADLGRRCQSSIALDKATAEAVKSAKKVFVAAIRPDRLLVDIGNR